MTIVKRIKLIRKKRRRRRKKKKRREPLVGWNPSLYHCLPDQTFRTMTVAMNSITNLIPKRSVWTIGKQQEPAATSKGRSTSRHSTRGTYDNHVTHFLHDNVTVEFHYWRIDWGIAGAANLSAGVHERRPSKKRWFTSYVRTIACKLMCARCTFFTSIRHRRFLPYRFYDSHTIVLFNDWLFSILRLVFKEGYRWEYYYHWILRVNFRKIILKQS